MNIKIGKIIVLSMLLMVFETSKAQNYDISRGLPFIRNYLPEEYHAHEKNFDIIQSENGIMYFANFAGVLHFDGSTWDKVSSSSGMRIVSVDRNNSGRIFAAGLYDFGFLETQSNGKLTFISLAEKSKNFKNIGLIFKVICVENKTFFFSNHEMFEYDGSKSTNTKFDGVLLNAFKVKQDIFLFFDPEKENAKFHGLYRFSNQNYEEIQLPADNPLVDINFMTESLNENEIILGSQRQGLFLLRNKQIEEWNAPCNDYLKTNSLTCCSRTNPSMYAFGTAGGGILLVKKTGEIVQLIDQSSGINDETINSLYIDKTSSLWIATDNGLTKAEVNWPLSYIENKKTGLEGKVEDIEFSYGRLYFATDKGLFFLDKNKINRINKLNFPNLSILKTGNLLLTATSRGIFIVDNSNNIKQASESFTFSLTGSTVNKDKVYSGHRNSVMSWNMKNNFLTMDYSIQNIIGDVVKILEDENGDLYFEVSPGRIYVFQTNNKKLTEIEAADELLSMHLNKKGDEIFISSEKGLYSIDKISKSLIKYNIVAKDSLSQKLWMHQIFNISGNTYIYSDGEQKNLSYISLDDKNITFNQTPFKPLADYSVQCIWFDDQLQQIWAGGKDGLIISGQNRLYDYTAKYKTQFRKIVLLAKDSLLNLNKSEEQRIKYADNSIVFEYSLPVYPIIGQVKYRYFLKGFDKDTSGWVSENKKEYTNLPSGTYLFMVEAQNEFGKSAQKATFRFRILTPLYRQWWAIILYAIALIITTRYFILWRMRSAKQEKERLEALVKERTEEIELSKHKIEEQRDIAYKQKMEILDSISYAQKIQQAVLPSKQYVDDILLEHFIFYRPRDIVSGDFYWMKKINNYVAVVAADCTGHGVPGAFMSMLGSSFLNEIITRRSLDNAAQILNRLRNRVKRSLHQEGKEGEQKDGMDIALIIIDSESLVLQYAGAYNPLFIIRANPGVDVKDESIDLENRFEFIHLKADRQPIGIHLNEKEFTNHVFQLNNGDCLYSFSDGYVDQFGGETGEKFKLKRFKDLLLSVQGRPMDEQKQVIEQAFYKWKRDLAQIDDVLVMGLKI